MADETPSETFDASDVAAVDNAAREDSRRARADADVLRNLMHSKQGRAWLYRFLESCHIFASPFSPGQSDVTFFGLGEENVGKKLMLATIAASSDLYMKMINEQREEEKRLDEVRRKERQNREASEPGAPLTPDLVPHLPPPAGYPGGPALPKKPNPKRGNR